MNTNLVIIVFITLITKILIIILIPVYINNKISATGDHVTSTEESISS